MTGLMIWNQNISLFICYTAHSKTLWRQVVLHILEKILEKNTWIFWSLSNKKKILWSLQVTRKTSKISIWQLISLLWCWNWDFNTYPDLKLLPNHSSYLMGNRSKSGKCGLGPTQKSQWGARSSTQDPHPWIGSPVGNQALILPKLRWNLLFAKIPSPWIEAVNVYCISLK